MSQFRAATLIALMSGVFASGAARAEDKPKAVIAILPIARAACDSNGCLNWATWGLEWEQPVSGLSYYLAPSIKNFLDGSPLTLALDIGIRFYPFAPVPRAFFIGPYVGGGYINGAPPGAPLGIQGELHAGVILGYSLLLGDLFLLSVGVGGEYYRNHNITTGGAITLQHEDIRTVIRAGFGFAF